MSLPTCTSCEAFVPSLTRACPHCGAAPVARRTWRRAMLLRLLGAAGTVSLMACYGAPYDPSYQPDCWSNLDCATGAQCEQSTSGYGVCVWTGVCSYDSECPPEQYCDVPRQTCTDGERPACDSPYDCDTDQACLDGACVDVGACDAANPTCGVGAVCAFGLSQCEPCEGIECGSCAIGDLPGVYLGTVPSCPEGTTPGVAGEVFLGSCIPDDVCLADHCLALDEAGCLAEETCDPTYRGVDCVGPDGGACVDGQPCTCAGYEFDSCDAVAAPL